MNKEEIDLIKNISNEFSKIIREWFTQEELDKINKENRERGYDNLICSTHDYSDANMAMDEAMEKCNVPRPSFCENDIENGLSSDTLIEEYGDLWGKAWQLSKENEFGMKELQTCEACDGSGTHHRYERNPCLDCYGKGVIID
tara:strand:- start:306 stop:734 length:429 start_codon:yes stop_codon:yes gene_type:complete